MAVQIQIRRGSAAAWATANPTPAEGELCYETDTGVLKIGDGDTVYASLDAFTTDGGGSSLAADITIADNLGLYTATNVEAALAEVKTIADSYAGSSLTLEEVRDEMGTVLTAGAGIAITPNDGSDIITIAISDLELSAISALVSAADTFPYFTGVGTAALANLSAAGRSLIDDANASAQLSTLGFTAFTKTLVDDADAATARTTLGVVSASESAAGLVELATDAEVATGTDTARAVTPAGVAANYSPSDHTHVIEVLVEHTIVYSIDGALTGTLTGVKRMVWPFDITVTGAQLIAGVAPAGEALIADIHKNGTTIFTTQANRPEVAIAGNASAVEVPDVVAVPAGQWLTVDIDQDGTAEEVTLILTYTVDD